VREDERATRNFDMSDELDSVRNHYRAAVFEAAATNS
jgi:hypothetical protein